MPSTARTPVAVCGTVREAVEQVSALVSSAGEWEAMPIRWPDLRALHAARARPAGGYVLVGASGDGSDGLAAELASRPPEIPLIAINAHPPQAAAPSCWLAQPPTAGVFNALLRQLIPLPARVPPAEPERVWRRKSDMIVGASAAISAVLHALDRAAPVTAPVLVVGESGTGKELVARALHYSGPRAAKPFVALNCAAVPETLFEAELFGYARGAFTGAVTARPGLIESADQGTLFLDELGEMPLALQPKLLRVLETGEVTRLGSNEHRRVDIRLVAATNRDLDQAVQQGRFRLDLLYRIRVLSIRLPPLRERPEDIAALVSHHLGLLSERGKHRPPTLTEAAMRRLLAYSWPGNVRELINVLQRAALLADGGQIDARHLDLPVDEAPLILPYAGARARFDAEYYERLMRATRGNVSHAARLADKTRKDIYEALRRLNLDPTQFR